MLDDFINFLFGYAGEVLGFMASLGVIYLLILDLTPIFKKWIPLIVNLKFWRSLFKPILKVPGLRKILLGKQSSIEILEYTLKMLVVFSIRHQLYSFSLSFKERLLIFLGDILFAWIFARITGLSLFKQILIQGPFFGVIAYLALPYKNLEVRLENTIVHLLVGIGLVIWRHQYNKQKKQDNIHQA